MTFDSLHQNRVLRASSSFGYCAESISKCSREMIAESAPKILLYAYTLSPARFCRAIRSASVVRPRRI